MFPFTFATLICLALTSFYKMNTFALADDSNGHTVAPVQASTSIDHLPPDSVGNPLHNDKLYGNKLSSRSMTSFQGPTVRQLTLVEFPSITPNDLFPPSASFVPNFIQSEIPTETLGKFDWDLDPTGELTVIFSDASKQGELSVSYIINLRQAIVEVRTVDCITVVDSKYVTVSHDTTIISSTHGRLDILVDIKQEAIINSPIWRSGNTTREGFLDMCLRVDLVADDDGIPTSINFHEQQIFVTIGLSQDFQVDTINLSRDDADTVVQDAQVDYGLVACQCNSTYNCAGYTLSQGDAIYVCIYSTDQNVVITAIEELDFSQGDSLTVGVIDGSEEDFLTSVIQLGPLAVIRSQVRSEFFVFPNPEDMRASGRAAISFANETVSGRRRLRSDFTRIQYESGNDAREATFEISMRLASTGGLFLVESHKFRYNIFILLGGILGGLACTTLIFTMVVLRRTRKKEGDENNSLADPASVEYANVQM